jgi:hypothetical protein
VVRRGQPRGTEIVLWRFELDSGIGAAHGMAGWCYNLRKWNGWMSDHMQETTETARLAERAAELGKDDAVALYTGGFALAHVVGDLKRGAAMIDRSLVLKQLLGTPVGG